MTSAIQRKTMRWTWLWVVAFAWAAPAFGGVTARVSGIGFGSFIRNDEWVPLVVQTTSDEPTPHAFDLQVVQTDVDGDDVVYTRTGIAVNTGLQTFRTYFRPESIDGGLPTSGGDAGGELTKRLRVFLFDPATGKRAVRVAVGGTQPQALEAGQLAGGQGQKLILVVGRSPNVREFSPSGNAVLGTAEMCFFVQVDPNRLPENALAYGAVDAIVWTDADSGRLSPAQVTAVRQYVQGGGTLAVVQNADSTRVAKFDDLLPVKVIESVDWASVEPLRSILVPKDAPPPRGADGTPTDPFRDARPPFRMARAEAWPDAIVDGLVTWPDGTRTPLVARHLVGLGCVAWLAQDVTDPAIAGVDFGWPRLWEKLFDWRDKELALTAAEPPGSLDALKAKFAPGQPRDLGASFLSATNLGSKTTRLISLTFVFFVGYWVLAGPACYFVLAARKQTQLSWFVYAAVAVAALALTVLIAQLVLRGGATVRHVSLVRVRGDHPDAGRVQSRFGVYLPKDTLAPVALPQDEAGPPVGLTPLALDPRYAPDRVSPRDSSYAVALDLALDPSADGGTDAAGPARVRLDVPFRSTLKKLQSDWTGPVAGRISGSPTLLPGDVPIDGRLSNDTGGDLADVMFVFRGPSQRRGDRVLTLPLWKKGQTIELGPLWGSADDKLVQLPSNHNGLPLLGTGPTRGAWDDGVTWLDEPIRRGLIPGNDAVWDDSDKNYGRSFPLVSLFGRCPPMSDFANAGTRVDLLRHGLRSWDVSPAVAAGALVVLGKSAGPDLPVPLTVEGEPPAVDAESRTFYQAVLPLDRSAVTAAASTRPADE